MRKYWAIFKVVLLTKLEYRFELLSTALTAVIGLSGVLILWDSVFKTTGIIGGLTKSQTVFYYVLIPFVALITDVKISGKLGNEIKDGQFSKYLLKPYKVTVMCFFESLAELTQRLIMVAPIYLLAIGIFVVFSGQQGLNGANFLVGFIFAVFGFMVHFFLDTTIAWVAFWIGDVWSFQHVKNFVFNIFGGLNFPLDFLKGTLRWLFEFLPFKFFFYIPVSYALGIRPQGQIETDVTQIIIWSLVLIIFGQILQKLGLKQFEAYGN